MLKTIYHSIRLRIGYWKACIKMKGTDIVVPDFYTVKDVVDAIVLDHKSLSRFGDGEFLWMLGNRLDSYQTYSDELKVALLDAINAEDPNLIIGVPVSFFNPNLSSGDHSKFWKIQQARIWPQLKNLVNWNRPFADASFTRPWSDKLDWNYANTTFSQLKRIWCERDICLIEGTQTKLGMGNDLFDGANSITRIICPACDAFQKRSQILSMVLEKVSKDLLILLALGPTASILSVLLSRNGYQAVDIGHIDLDYMWFLSHSAKRVNIPGKYVNEAGHTKCIQADLYDDDINYQMSIIGRIE